MYVAGVQRTMRSTQIGFFYTAAVYQIKNPLCVERIVTASEATWYNTVCACILVVTLAFEHGHI